MTLRISFCHHLSLSYYSGGEKWIIATAKELVKRGHEIEIYALPLLLDGKPKINPKEILEGIPYSENYRKKVKADVVYVTYNPLSWLNFQTSHPKIGGMHSQIYWKSPNPRYGIFPVIANLTNRFTSYFDLREFDAIHTVTNVYPINHPKIYYIPNFVDSKKYRPVSNKDREFTLAYCSRKVWQKGYDMLKEIEKALRIKTKISGGEVPEELMPNFYSTSHASIVPTRVDTWGFTIVESALCETPVLTTRLPTHLALDIPSLIYADTISEYLLEIKLLKHLWEEHEKRYMELAKRCRVEALKYDKEIIMNKLENMFTQVAGDV